MKEVVQKLSRSEEVVLKLGAGTCLTPKARMLRDQHRTFARCDMSCEQLTAAEVRLMITFAFQVLHSEFETSSSGEVKAIAKLCKDEGAALLASKNASVWVYLARIDPAPVMPGLTVRFISAFFEYYYLDDMYPRLSSNMWWLVRRTMLQLTVLIALFGSECDPLGLNFRRFKVCREKGGNALSVCRSLEDKIILVSYYVSPAYADL